VKRILLLASSLLAAAPAAGVAESGRYGSFELGAGTYHPNIDEQPSLTEPRPYGQVFGTARGWMFRAGVSRALFTSAGALEVGFRTGYFRDADKGLQILNGQLTNEKGGDPTTFNIIPTSLTLTYRFDVLAERLPIPLAPYGRVALERYNWWVTGSSGSMGKVGATNGYSATGGIAFLLDFFDPGLAREMDADTGINHTYLFADVTRSWVDDFGSSKSWDLSTRAKLSYGFGMMFVF
jgi:hypothetical protein